MNQMWRHVFDHAPIGMARLSAYGRFLEVNRAFCKMFGYQESELLGQSPSMLMDEKSRKKETEWRQRVLTGDSSSVHKEMRCTRQDGVSLWGQFSITGIMDSDNQEPFLIYQVQDRTQWKLASEQRDRLHGEKERNSQQRSRQLEIANRALQTFAYTVSHDLRAPLRAMTGFSDALLEDYGDQLDATAKNYIERIDQAAERMGELIDSILSLSRTTSGELKYVAVDVSGMAEAVIEELHDGEPERKLSVQIEPGLTDMADEKLLRAVVENLIGNAWKYSSEAPQARIVFGRARKRFNGHTPGTQGTYFVRDNGIGFDMASANKIFHPFQRINTDTQYQGTGIGLATVERIIHRHNGEIWAESTPGEGATFYFTLNGNHED